MSNIEKLGFDQLTLIKPEFQAIDGFSDLAKSF